MSEHELDEDKALVFFAGQMVALMTGWSAVQPQPAGRALGGVAAIVDLR